MSLYRISHGSPADRAYIQSHIHGLEQASPPMQDRIITAWVSTWRSSPYTDLADAPTAPGVDHPLLSHVNAVTSAGLTLAKHAAAQWTMHLDTDTLLATLILHDVDKPLMFERHGTEIRLSQTCREIPHGVLGAMLLKDLDFDHTVVSTIALHAGNAPYHAINDYAYILHYADYFAADHMLMRMGRKPTYQK